MNEMKQYMIKGKYKLPGLSRVARWKTLFVIKSTQLDQWIDFSILLKLSESEVAFLIDHRELVVQLISATLPHAVEDMQFVELARS
jgi:hypothetical protein